MLKLITLLFSNLLPASFSYAADLTECRSSNQINEVVRTNVRSFARKHDIRFTMFDLGETTPEDLRRNPTQWYFEGKNRSGAPVTIYIHLELSSSGGFNSNSAYCVIKSIYAQNDLNGAIVR